MIRLLSFLVATGLALPLVTAAQRPQPGIIRSRIAMVPLDVRVVDRKGNPITGLKKEDFTIIEDGEPQEVAHFTAQTLSADPTRAGADPELLLPGSDLRVQSRRVFLLLLGRGRMGSGASKELEALTAFLKERLLPQDVVALIAYNRATDFTTNHGAIVDIIEKYRARATQIETDLFEWFSGLRAAYGPTGIPPFIQKQIDAIFADSAALRPREIVPGQITDKARLQRDLREATNELLRAQAIAEREGGLTDVANARTVERLGVTLDEHLQRSVVTNHDVSNIYAGIEYMRFIDGEKHLVLITPQGIDLPRAENERSIAAAAADSRIAMDFVYTGGLAGAPAPTAKGSSPLPSFVTTSRQLFNIEGMRSISELTGGHTTAYRYGDVAMNRLDVSTRSQYLLGYYPKNTRFDGGYRRIAVKVNRKGVDVMHRRGYFAQDRISPLDKREFISFTRIAAAASYAITNIEDLKIALRSPKVAGSGNAREVSVEVQIGPERVAFKDELGLKVAALDIALFAATNRGEVVGERWQTIDLRLPPDAYARFQKEGATLTVSIPLKNYPKQIKAVLYNFNSDLLGTTSVMVY